MPHPAGPIEETVLPAPCKINLHLRILGRRTDGYHDLETLFFPLPEPADSLSIRRFAGPGEQIVRCSDPALSGPDNLVARACRAYADATGYSPALDVFLDKRIPAGSGLGGASSDAARMLGYLDGRSPAPLGPERLRSLGAALGSDVPFFLGTGPALARGRGDELSPADVDLAGWTLVVACPRERVATAWAYAAYDRAAREGGIPPESLLTRAFRRNIRPFCVTGLPLSNSFERVVFAALPGLRRLKETLFSLGAGAAALSGSGSAMFGLFREREGARRAVSALGRQGVATWLASF
jgi:4-diphosphocytidyl-2-C-methyl-D-erythritol kinase